MMDIKVKKPIKKDPMPIVAEIPKEESVGEFRVSTKKVNGLSIGMFTLMTLSLACYIFMISSSVFYAVKSSQYAFDGNNLPVGIVSHDMDQSFSNKQNSGRISYINKDSATSISLK